MGDIINKIGSDSKNQIRIRMNMDKLLRVEKILGKRYMVQVGILGEKAGGRAAVQKMKLGTGKKLTPVYTGDSMLTNADIGTIHEKGSKSRNIPRRSFLEVPLTTEFPKKMKTIGAAIFKGITEDNIEVSYRKIGSLAEGVVLKAFSTSGYGQWPSKKDGTPSHLIDTGQLRASIANRVVTR